MDDDPDHENVEYERVWRVVPVNALPFPFHLWKCPFEQRHLRALETVGADPDDYANPEQCSNAFDIFVADLGAEIVACPYHLPNWKLAAERAIEATTRDPHDAITKLAIEDLDNETEWAAWEFFAEPIRLDGNRLGNGQHRTCAMKCAGVLAAPIEDYRPVDPNEAG